MQGKTNKDAEMAYMMAMKLFQSVSDERAIQIWDECHKNEKLQKMVSTYVYSTPTYAPKALHKLHTELVEVFS